jgi:hypothetical protein
MAETNSSRTSEWLICTNIRAFFSIVAGYCDISRMAEHLKRPDAPMTRACHR